MFWQSNIKSGCIHSFTLSWRCSSFWFLGSTSWPKASERSPPKLLYPFILFYFNFLDVLCIFMVSKTWVMNPPRGLHKLFLSAPLPLFNHTLLQFKQTHSQSRGSLRDSARCWKIQFWRDAQMRSALTHDAPGLLFPSIVGGTSFSVLLGELLHFSPSSSLLC